MNEMELLNSPGWETFVYSNPSTSEEGVGLVLVFSMAATWGPRLSSPDPATESSTCNVVTGSALPMAVSPSKRTSSGVANPHPSEESTSPQTPTVVPELSLLWPMTFGSL
ncbi:MAG: hypothetical protein V5A43_04680 [Haloarculaceae archaeon]